MSVTDSRKKYLVDTGLQFRYMLAVFGSALLVLAVVIATFYFNFWIYLAQGMIETGSEDIYEIFLRSNRVFLARLAVVIILLACVSILLSHKIAGPIFRLKSIFGQIRDRDLSMMVQFRKKDEFKDLAAEANEMIQSLKDVISSEKNLVSELENLVNEARDQGKPVPAGELAEILGRLKDQIDSFKTE